MKKDYNCPLCKKEIYSGIGNGCMMCGMLLVDKDETYCCNICMRRHNKINKPTLLKKA